MVKKSKNLAEVREEFKKATGIDVPPKPNVTPPNPKAIHIFSPKNNGMKVKVIERSEE